MRALGLRLLLAVALAGLPGAVVGSGTGGTSSTTAASVPAVAGPRTLNFDVFLDDRAIGYQRFALSPAADGLRIETRAEFAVRILGITAFSYDHANTETWRGGCLQSIESRTDSNGKLYTVRGQARGSALVVATKEGERRLDECVATFAYWDRRKLLPRERLLNSQTGEYLPVQIDALGRQDVRIGARAVSVERFAIRGKGLDITLGYAAGSGEWVTLDSRLENGRTLRYRRKAAELYDLPTGGLHGSGSDLRRDAKS
ncbi:MAG: DUF6134 family protein [Pseudomonadota bacterium]